ncbi:MAG: hypothetical protein RJB11_131 [Planctomycetota bacterium]
MFSLRSFFRDFSLLTDKIPTRRKTRKRCRETFLPRLERLEKREVAAADMSIGMNVETVVDWSSAWTFTDAFKTSRPWISHAYNTVTGVKEWEGGGPVQIDSKGWPKSLSQWRNAQGQLIQQHLGTLMFRDIGSAYPTGVYRAEWLGSGTVNWGFAATVLEQGKTAGGKNYALLNVIPNTDGIYMEIASMSSSEPIRDVHVWMPDALGKNFSGQIWEPGSSFSPFHPQFLEKLSPFKTIRFMDWAETNLSDIQTWSDRKTYDYATQQSGDFHNGIAIEYMIQLCNDLDADAWFNMPHAADDTFVRNFATLVRDTLEPGRKVYIEWSNELWNFGWGFEASDWVTGQLSLPQNAYLNWDRWALVGREARRDFDIWTEVFAGQEQRLTRVVAGQEANSWIAEQIAMNMAGHFDAISCAAYMYVSDNDRNTFNRSTTAAQVIDSVKRNLPTALGWLRDHKNLADRLSASMKRPIRFVAYEGGPHLDSQGGVYEQAFFEAGNSPGMYDLYKQLIDGANANGLGLFMHYSFTGGLYPSSVGSFGALQSMTQSTSTAPKYRALLDALRPAPVLPTVAVSTIRGNASEAGPTAGVWVVSRTGSTDVPLTVGYTLNGTASPTDYTGIPAVLSFAVGESSKSITVLPVDDAIVEATEQLVFTIKTGVGYTLDTTKASGVIGIQDNDIAPRLGLQGTYYDNKDFTSPKLTRIDPNVGFNWGSGSPDPLIGRDTFSVRWVGQLQAIESGSYSFRTFSDDGVRLWMNGALVVNNWTIHGGTYNTSPTIKLVAGQKVDLKLEYFENTGSAIVRMEWRRPGGASYQVIPQSQLLAPSDSNLLTTSSSTVSSSMLMVDPFLTLDDARKRALKSSIYQS